MDLTKQASGITAKLAEVGKKISKANADKLRKALQEISDLLAQVSDSMTEADRSAADKTKLLQRALYAKLGENSYCYVADIFDTYAIYYNASKYYRADYTLAEDGAATFGAATEVIPQTVYNDAPGSVMAESGEVLGDCVPLVESATALSEAATAQLKLISPGWGSSGYYAPSVLQHAASQFTKGTKMFWNHQTAAEEASRPEGDLNNLAGELLEDARYDAKGPTGPGLYARAKVFDRFAGSVKDLAEHIGVSIRAMGTAKQGEAEGRRGPVIERIDSVRSVDYVTVPGRGGKILNLFEAAGRRSAPAREENREENTMTEEQIKALITEANKPLQESLAAVTTDNKRLREALALREAGDFVTKKLATIALPAITKARLTESLVAKAALTAAGALDTAALTAVIEADVKAEGEYLASVTGGTIRGMGSKPVAEAAAVTEADLVKAYVGIGMSEAAAKAAIAGREVYN